MAQIDDVYGIRVALAVVGVFQGVIFSLYGEGKIGGQIELHRQGDPAFDDAIAETGRGRWNLDIGHERHGEGAAIVADEIDFDFQNRVAEAMAVGDQRAGLVTVRHGVLIAVEDHLEIDRVGEAELYGRVGDLPKPRREARVIA